MGPPRGSILDDHYLVLGLNAMARAHEMNYFADGHKGAAIVASHYLCRESDVGSGVPEVLTDMLDEHWAQGALCAPFPEQEPDPALIDRVVAASARTIGQLRGVGHNVIFASLALKAFRDVPQAVTPARVAGIVELIEAFDTTHDVPVGEDDHVPELESPAVVAEFLLAELLRTMEAFEGRGQGWSGHLLTFGRALLDLAALGHRGLADAGRPALREYVSRVRMGPQDTDKVYAEHGQNQYTPLEQQYWERRRGQSVGIGHCFKYPYGFYGLMALARDGSLKERCAAEAYHIF